MTQVKGSNIRLLEAYAREHAGEDGWHAILERLAREDREIVVGAIAMGWYELSLQHRLFQALESVLATGGADAIGAFGAYAAEHDLTRVHRLFLRLRNPAFVLEKSGEYWSRFYNAGTWKVVRLSPTSARGELVDLPERAPVFCRFLSAYICSMFELAGAKSTGVVHRQCACRGAPSCVFEGTWVDRAE